ncbi:STAS domain-containing protein [Chitinimonas koreensis]|uniref:STAS domain-containing protein n=1 Tax=Chitinimonas koreensis TaxID=356302 RepID=UPI000412AAC2|nr:STAS domain-containing protein [Chitinimonas koreensis]QNM96002.1 STAS domain-containing protein [Chitinimonas koreensis]
MTISAVYLDGRCILRIDGPLTIYEAGESKLRLLDELNLAQIVEVDLAGVAELDTAGIQLLLLLKREAMRQNKPIAFQGHSKAVLAVIDLYNMAAVFGDPVVISGQGAR